MFSGLKGTKPSSVSVLKAVNVVGLIPKILTNACAGRQSSVSIWKALGFISVIAWGPVLAIRFLTLQESVNVA
jgi:hypothetical protein